MSDSVDKAGDTPSLKNPVKGHEWSMTIHVDRGGSTETIRCREIGYDVFKASRSYLASDPEKAMKILVNDVVISEDKDKALAILDSNNFIALTSMEDAFSQMITPIPAEIKKK